MRAPASLRLLMACALAGSFGFGERAVWAADPTMDESLNAHQRAQRLVKAGELRAAKEKLLLCQESTCPAVVREDCRERLVAVEKATPTIVFVALDSQGNELNLAGVGATIDDVLLADQLSGAPVVVDPGEHVFRLEYLGLPPASRSVTVVEGEKGRRVVVSFAAPESRGRPTDAVRVNRAPDEGRPREPALDPSLELGVLAGYSAGPYAPNSGFGAALFGVDVGFRILRYFYVGALFEYSTSAPGITDCPASSAQCGLRDERVGVDGQVHFASAGNLDPWFGLGGGWELAQRHPSSPSPNDGAFAQLTLGIDVRIGQFALGPYGSALVAELGGTGPYWTVGLRGTFEAVHFSP